VLDWQSFRRRWRRRIRCGRSSRLGRSHRRDVAGRLGQGVAALERGHEAGSELLGIRLRTDLPRRLDPAQPSARPPIQASKPSATSVRATWSRSESWATSEPSTRSRPQCPPPAGARPSVSAREASRSWPRSRLRTAVNSPGAVNATAWLLSSPARRRRRTYAVRRTVSPSGKIEEQIERLLAVGGVRSRGNRCLSSPAGGQVDHPARRGGRVRRLAGRAAMSVGRRISAGCATTTAGSATAFARARCRRSRATLRSRSRGSARPPAGHEPPSHRAGDGCLTAAVRPARRRWPIRPGRRPSPTP
jgi:hypothetical protein